MVLAIFAIDYDYDYYHFLLLLLPLLFILLMHLLIIYFLCYNIIRCSTVHGRLMIIWL